MARGGVACRPAAGPPQAVKRLRGRVSVLGLSLAVLMVFVNQRLAAQSYEPYVQILEGSVKCRQGILGSPGGPMLSYDAWLTDPNGNTIATHDKVSYTYRLDGEYSVEPVIDGTYTCYARLFVDGTQIAYLQQSRHIVVQIPSSLNNYNEANLKAASRQDTTRFRGNAAGPSPREGGIGPGPRHRSWTAPPHDHWRTLVILW